MWLFVGYSWHSGQYRSQKLFHTTTQPALVLVTDRILTNNVHFRKGICPKGVSGITYDLDHHWLYRLIVDWFSDTANQMTKIFLCWTMLVATALSAEAAGKTKVFVVDGRRLLPVV